MMNVQYSQIQELMLYEFELGYNAIESIKNICCAKGEDAVDPTTVTRCFKKFCLGCKNLNNQTRLGSPKAMLQVIKANLGSKLGISLSSVVHHFQDLSKNIQSCWIVSHFS